jgi:putative salt-induced outer membrane protein
MTITQTRLSTRLSTRLGKCRRLRHAIVPLALSLAVTGTAPDAAAHALPAGVDTTLRQAAERDADAFRAALRQAIAASPGYRDAILGHALAAHPQRSGELLLDGLFAPPLQPPTVSGTVHGDTNGRTNGQTTAHSDAQPQQPDKKPEAIEEEGSWNGTFVLGATVRTGNTDNAGATSELTVAYDEGPWRHRGEASVDYLRNRTQTQEQAFLGQYEAQRELTARDFIYGLARYEDDRFSGFDYEFTSSVGLGRRLVQEPGHEWTVTLGPSLRLAQPSDSDDQNRAVGGRFTNLLSWELSDTAKLENETEALVDTERVRVDNDVVLKVRIIDQLSGQISFGFVYRSDTPEDAEHTDTTTRAAVVYDF